MLGAANGGATQTVIMYKCFMSYQQLKEYLAMAIARDFIKFHAKEKTFFTTERGIKFIELYEKMHSLVPNFQ